MYAYADSATFLVLVKRLIKSIKSNQTANYSAVHRKRIRGAGVGTRPDRLR